MKKIDIYDYAGDIVKAIPNGVLLTTRAGETTDTMTIGWGTLGTNWGRPVFAAYLRRHRYTVELLKKNPQFTVNVPLGDFDKKIIAICGSCHGNEVDKIAKAGLTPVDSQVVSVPGFKELPLTLECKVIYTQLQELGSYPEDIMKAYYPQDVDSSATGSNKDPHYTVFGEIVNAYIAG
ncbi:MAG: flavin reductase family protein [Anaerovoracaceae bacterium]